MLRVLKTLVASGPTTGIREHSRLRLRSYLNQSVGIDLRQELLAKRLFCV